MDVPKLFLLVLAIIAGVNCDLTQSINAGLLNFAYFNTNKTYTNVAKDAVFIYDEYNVMLFEVVVSAIYPILIKVSSRNGEPCFLRSQSRLPFVGGFNAFHFRDGKLLITLRSTAFKNSLVATPNDLWELFILDPETCGIMWKPITPDPNYYVSAVKLKLNPKSFDIFVKLTDISGISKLKTILYDYVNDKVSGFKYYDSLTTAKETIVLDDDSNVLYFIKDKIQRQMEIAIEPSKYFYTLDKRNLDNVPKTLIAEYDVLTFCYGNELKKNVIECAKFSTRTGELLYETSVFSTQDIVKIFVKNINAYYTLLIWVEDSGKNTYDVKGQLLSGDTVVFSVNIFSTNYKVSFITYDMGINNHCLTIGTVTDPNVAIARNYCFQ